METFLFVKITFNCILSHVLALDLMFYDLFYNNQKDKIDWLNGKIDGLNIEHGMIDYLGVHKHGIRVVTRKWQDHHGQLQKKHIKKHRWEQWREKVRSNMLHLTNDRRFVLGKAVNEFFINRT